MIERFVGIFGMALLGLFVGYMAYRVPAVPFVIIVVGVFSMLIYDYVRDVWWGKG